MQPEPSPEATSYVDTIELPNFIYNPTVQCRSVPFTDSPSTGTYPEQDQSSSHHLILSLSLSLSMVHTNIIHPHKHWPL
jgi:hypothetical protein